MSTSDPLMCKIAEQVCFKRQIGITVYSLLQSITNLNHRILLMSSFPIQQVITTSSMFIRQKIDLTHT